MEKLIEKFNELKKKHQRKNKNNKVYTKGNFINI